MSVERLTLDTNILFYSLDADAGERQERARAVVERAVEQHGLALWDAMQWAVAKQFGATLMLSEDLQHARELKGVRFRNPFVVSDPFASGSRWMAICQPMNPLLEGGSQ